MKAVLHVNNAAHQKEHCAAMKEGLARHGIESEFAPSNEPRPCDFAVVWGWRQKRVIEAVPHTLVMERGHIQPRMTNTSCGWDGLARRGRYPVVNDGGARWREHYAHLMQGWRHLGEYALLIGQVRGDAALYGMDFDRWAQEQCDELIRCGYDVVFRPHPLMVRSRDVRCPNGARLSKSPDLWDDLKNAQLCVTFNSTTGVEAVLAGVPTITLDEGAMAWPVTSHSIAAGGWMADRDDWAHQLAWTQWTLDEISRGVTWDYLKELI